MEMYIEPAIGSVSAQEAEGTPTSTPTTFDKRHSRNRRRGYRNSHHIRIKRARGNT